MRAILVTALFIAFGAQAEGIPRTIDLDRPGALAALEKQRPDHYRAVVQTIRAAEKMHCGIDYRLLRTGDRNPCSSYMIRTSYPAQVSLSIPVDESRYVVTAYLDTSLDRVSPAK